MSEKFGEKKEKSAAEMRKINKPLMEKKRRERINNCLNQLKMFLMDATKKDSSYYSKLEKADILEMTVKYLKNLQRQHMAAAMTSDPKLLGKYAAGFSQCASEVTRYLSKVDGSVSSDVRNRLFSHLNGCLQKMPSNQSPPSATVTCPPQGVLPLAHAQPLGVQLQSHVVSATASTPQQLQQQQPQQQLPLDVQFSQPHVQTPTPAATVTSQATTVLLNNPTPTQTTQPTQNLQPVQNVPVLPVQLIPAKLPSGDMVLLLTNTQSGVPMTNIVTPQNVVVPQNIVSAPNVMTSQMNVLTSLPNVMTTHTSLAAPSVTFQMPGMSVCTSSSPSTSAAAAAAAASTSVTSTTTALPSNPSVSFTFPSTSAIGLPPPPPPATVAVVPPQIQLPKQAATSTSTTKQEPADSSGHSSKHSSPIDLRLPVQIPDVVSGSGSGSSSGSRDLFSGVPLSLAHHFDFCHSSDSSDDDEDLGENDGDSQNEGPSPNDQNNNNQQMPNQEDPDGPMWRPW